MQRQARVIELTRSWKGAQTLRVQVTAAPANAIEFLPGENLRAIAYPDLVGSIRVGELLRIDCSAMAKGLGTGGYATVLATATLPADELVEVGHVVKARYLPHQRVVLAAEEADSPIHEAVAAVTDLEQLPVVVADLHSALPAIVAGVREVKPDAKVVYIHDDSASLPLRWSRSVSDLEAHHWLDATISAGQSFGGTWEAASIPSAMAVAKAIGAECAIICPGPGNLGTGTRWGFSSIASAANLHYAQALNARVVACVRASQADRRSRHRGISHHTLTVLRDLTLVPVTVALPDVAAEDVPADVWDNLTRARHELSKHELRTIAARRCDRALSACPIELMTMGRDYHADPLAFLAGSAAGIVAGEWIR